MQLHDHHKNVQDLHNAMAKSQNPALGTVRPSGTTSRDLKRISLSIMRNLNLEDGNTLLDIGCGNGMLSALLLSKLSRYVGVDYSIECLKVFGARHSLMKSKVEFKLFEGNAILDLKRFGQFDRVLAYASFHYMETESEASDLLKNMLASVKSGGLLLVGNLPLSDLPTFTVGESQNDRKSSKVNSLLRWIFLSERTIIHTRWKLAATTHLLYRKAKRKFIASKNHVSLPPLEIVPLELTTEKLRQWLSGHDREMEFAFIPTCARAPLAIGRADLVVKLK